MQVPAPFMGSRQNPRVVVSVVVVCASSAEPTRPYGQTSTSTSLSPLTLSLLPHEVRQDEKGHMHEFKTLAQTGAVAQTRVCVCACVCVFRVCVCV